MKIDRPRWIDTPGLEYLGKYLVPEAAAILSSQSQYYPVLIEGQSGTGKSYIKDSVLTEASIHQEKVMVVNCAAIPPDLVESELFGHKRGSFTGAVSDHPGLVGIKGIEVLVLDEIGTLPVNVQAKLLVFLESGEYKSVGDTRINRSQVRILGMTNSQPETTFREDFLYRFHRVKIPPLSQRRTDILYLIEGFAPDLPWSTADLWCLLCYHWPGNVRELRQFAISASRAVEKGRRGLNAKVSVLEYVQSILPARLAGIQPPDSHNSPLGPRWSTFSLFLDRLRGLDRVEGFRPAKDSHGGRLFEKTVEPICPWLNVSRWWRKAEIRHLVLKGTDKASKKLYSDAAEYFPHHWNVMCQLFWQDPHHEEDILQNIVSGHVTKSTMSEDVTQHLGNEEIAYNWFQLRNEIWRAFYRNSDRSGESLNESGETPSPREEEEAQRDNRLHDLLDSMSPIEFKNRWIAHHLDIGPANAARKYGLNQKTVAGWFRRYRKRSMDDS